MDCGPAALAILLQGHGVHAHVGRLREACQADVDGTSLDALEEVCQRLGLDAEQGLLPVDHLLLPEATALPALVVTRTPSGLLHFVVLWARLGPLVQVSDPAVGRRWVAAERRSMHLERHTTIPPTMHSSCCWSIAKPWP